MSKKVDLGPISFNLGDSTFGHGINLTLIGKALLDTDFNIL